MCYKTGQFYLLTTHTGNRLPIIHLYTFYRILGMHQRILIGCGKNRPKQSTTKDDNIIFASMVWLNLWHIDCCNDSMQFHNDP